MAVPGPDESCTTSLQPRVTELLFYASHGQHSWARPLTPPPSSPSVGSGGRLGEGDKRKTLSVYALALSSDLLCEGFVPESTPPASPLSTGTEADATFLASRFPTEAQVINVPPIRKRKSATDAFDEASERRKKARRKGGQGVSSVAATKVESQMPTLQHHRSYSNSQSVQSQPRPLSRSPSVASSRPQTGVAAGARRSTLSRVQSVANVPDASDLEMKNKDIISRIVMTGMRFHGLSQSKNRRSRAGSSAPSPAIDASFEELEAERKNDEEYKLVYHQTFKGTCFAFRTSMIQQSLQPLSETIRDVADRLLGIFCIDPLVRPGGVEDRVTSSGRKAFGFAVQQHEASTSVEPSG